MDNLLPEYIPSRIQRTNQRPQQEEVEDTIPAFLEKENFDIHNIINYWCSVHEETQRISRDSEFAHCNMLYLLVQLRAENPSHQYTLEWMWDIVEEKLAEKRHEAHHAVDDWDSQDPIRYALHNLFIITEDELPDERADHFPRDLVNALRDDPQRTKSITRELISAYDKAQSYQRAVRLNTRFFTQILHHGSEI